MIVFDLVEVANDGDHTFAVYDCQSDSDLVDVLADTIRDLYVDPEHLRDVLIAAMNDADAVADGAAIEETINRTLTAAIPEPGTHPIPHLDVARNELAEALAHLAFAGVHGTVIPAARIRHKEVGGQPSRGRDLLGLEEEPLLAPIFEERGHWLQGSRPLPLPSRKGGESAWTSARSGAALVGVVLGQLLILATGWLQRRWTKSDLRSERADTRAEVAAEELLDLFAEVRQLNEGNHTQETTRDDGYESEYELSHRIERCILLIPTQPPRGSPKDHNVALVL